MDNNTAKKSIELLEKYLTEDRLKLINNKLEQRTNYIIPVLENIYQPQNASAVMRTCDCLGIQDLHIIENSNKYELNPQVVLGSYKWVNTSNYNELENNTKTCLNKLKKDGYRIVATSPHSQDVSLYDFDLNKGKSAFIFGTELTGLSDTVMDMADEYVKIPMVGFTESFNISVSAAIILSHLSNELRKSEINWKLSEKDYNSTKLKWLVNSIVRGDEILKEELNRIGINIESNE
ncbi:MAG: RNA methyltransferase [Marinifilaceae bacterium]|jgi:tRNA (guanosine-2'-O-)-methyltransferase|nr:RNA methyltransferase [Marinifilaceae bacterium]